MTMTDKEIQDALVAAAIADHMESALRGITLNRKQASFISRRIRKAILEVTHG